MSTATKKPKQEERVFINKPMKLKRLRIKIIGDAPLVMHRFSEKAQKEIAHRQSGKAQSKTKPARDPKAEYEAAFYLDAKGKPCIPAECFKNCVVTAAQRFYDVTKVMLYGSLYIIDATMKLEYERVEMNQSTVRLSGMNRPADLRYRPMFHGWMFDVHIEYDSSHFDPETLAEFITRAGFSVGLFEHRIDKGGAWGRFHIADEKELALLAKKNGKPRKAAGRPAKKKAVKK